MTKVVLRERTDADLDACIRAVAEVRHVDGYPPFLPGDDYVQLLTSPTPLAAFVATVDDRVVGHVALNDSTGEAAVALACERLGVERTQLGVVARLFSAVDRRGQGIGRLLLDAATDAARSRGLVPILDVWVELRAAIAMYESAGWQPLGSVTYDLPNGPHEVNVFAAPSRPSS